MFFAHSAHFALYDEARLPARQRSGLNYMMIASILGNLFIVVCAGGTAAMVGLATHFGAGDMGLGVLVAIPQVAAILQLPFSALVNRTRRRKRYMLSIGLFSRILWLPIAFLPLLTEGRIGLGLLIGLLALSSALGAVINVCWFSWFSDMAPIRIRGRWMSFRDLYISVSGLLFALLVSLLLDVLPGNLRFPIVFALGALMGIGDMLCYARVDDPEPQHMPPSRIGKMLGDILKDKPFMRFTLMWTAWCFTANMAGAYLTPYAMNHMGLSFLQYTLFGTVTASMATAVVIPRWGRILDHFGSRNVMLICCYAASLSQVFYLFSSKGNIWPTFLHNLIGATFWSGSNLAANSMQMSLSSDDTRPSYIAVFSCVTALAGTALGTLCGGWFLGACEKYAFFTGSFDRYKALVALAVALRFTIVMVLGPGLKRDHPEGVRDVTRALFKRKRGRIG
jgi:MFS family permease